MSQVARLEKFLTNLGASSRDEEGVTAEYPSRFTLRDALQFVLGDPGLENGQGVEQAHGRDHCAPSSDDDHPGFKTAVGIIDLVSLGIIVCLRKLVSGSSVMILTMNLPS